MRPFISKMIAQEAMIKITNFLLLLLINYQAIALEPTSTNYQLITMGTGNITGLYYTVGGSICRLVNEKIKEFGIRCAVEYSDGAVANFNSLMNKKIDLAIMQNDVFYDAISGTGYFANQPPNKSLKLMLSLFPESLTVMVRSNSAINSFEDIKGKRVVMGNDGSGSKELTNKLFNFYGWKTEDFVSLEAVDISTHSQALCDNKIDVMITHQGHPNSTIKEATTTCDVTILEVVGDKINEFLNSSPYYQTSTIPGGIYAGNPNDITTFGNKALLVTTDNIDHITIYNITKSILNSFNNFKALNPVFASSDINVMIDGISVNYLHEGAAKYLKEQNLLPQ